MGTWQEGFFCLRLSFFCFSLSVLVDGSIPVVAKSSNDLSAAEGHQRTLSQSYLLPSVELILRYKCKRNSLIISSFVYYPFVFLFLGYIYQDEFLINADFHTLQVLFCSNLQLSDFLHKLLLILVLILHSFFT